MTVRECTRCIMNSDVDPDIVLVDGVCNHCLRYDALLESRVVPVEQRPAKLAQVVEAISRAGRGGSTTASSA